MAVKVAINGFGRIGRLAFRQMFGHEGYRDRCYQRPHLSRYARLPAEVRFHAGQLQTAITRLSPVRIPSPSMARPSRSTRRPTPTTFLGATSTSTSCSSAPVSTPARRRLRLTSTLAPRRSSSPLRPARTFPPSFTTSTMSSSPLMTTSSPLLPAPPTASLRWLRV